MQLDVRVRLLACNVNVSRSHRFETKLLFSIMMPHWGQFGNQVRFWSGNMTEQLIQCMLLSVRRLLFTHTQTPMKQFDFARARPGPMVPIGQWSLVQWSQWTHGPWSQWTHGPWCQWSHGPVPGPNGSEPGRAGPGLSKLKDLVR